LKHPLDGYGDWHAFHNTYTSFVGITKSFPEEPVTYKEPINFDDVDKLQIAIIDEYQSLMDNGTWILCDLPSTKILVKCKWVYKLKLKPNGTIDRYKVHLVAKGYS
jgi:histone deacetylase 1/2